MTDREPTAPFRRGTPPGVASGWIAQSTTVFDTTPRGRLARGSTAPWPRPDSGAIAATSTDVDDRDVTTPIPRLVALVEPVASIAVRLDEPRRPAPQRGMATEPVPSIRPQRGAMLTIVVLAIAALLLVLMLFG